MCERENLRRFKIVYSENYMQVEMFEIQIISNLEHFRTQILIDKRNNISKFEGNNCSIKIQESSLSSQELMRSNLLLSFWECLKSRVTFFCSSWKMSIYNLLYHLTTLLSIKSPLLTTCLIDGLLKTDNGTYSMFSEK